jgi:glycosyltransferase involved in cell wall biosynthesis
MSIELTVAVTAHAEDFLLRPTLNSVALALDEVTAAGHTSELLIVLDRPSEWTRREALRWRDDVHTSFEVRTLEVDNGESGASRNSAVTGARGEVLALCDGDDLVSRGFFSTALTLITASPVATIVHPETVLSFGDRALKWTVRSTDDPNLKYTDLLTTNLWPSCSVSRRETYVRYPYPVLQPGSGFGPEDYSWNITTATGGVRHVIAPNSVFFYRTRTHGGVNNAHSGSVLPAFDISALAAGFPTSTSGENEGATAHLRWRRPTTRDVALAMRPSVRAIYRLLPERVRGPLGFRIRRAHAELLLGRRKLSEPEPSLINALKDAAELEPALSWTADGAKRLESWAPQKDAFAAVLESLSALLEDTEVLILAPWVGIGGADLVTLNYASAFAEASEVAGRVTILTTYLPERTNAALVPNGVDHYQLDPVFRSWPLERQQRLIAQLVAQLRPRIILSINCFDFTNALRNYAKPICAASDVYLSLFAFDRIGDGSYPVNPITDDPQRSFLHEIRGIITDNTVTAGTISNILGVDPPFVRVHHQSAALPAHDFDEVVKQTAAYYDSEFTPEFPFRVMWPHRLDKEKRPDSLLRIAQRIQAARLPIELHIYGQRVLGNGNTDLLPELAKSGATYHGPYAGGLATLPTEDFHALLLTSESEGMPLVLAQSLLLGLPVVASAVGGVRDLISHGITGLLTDGPDDIDGFVDSLIELMDSRDKRRALIRAGYDRASAQHGIGAFNSRTLTAFGLSS